MYVSYGKPRDEKFVKIWILLDFFKNFLKISLKKANFGKKFSQISKKAKKFEKFF